jgi:6-phospho-beta-glucosidase
MTDRTKVVILGGSALATPVLFQVMGKQGARRAFDFVLHGRDSERLERVRQVSQAIVQSSPDLDIRISAATRLEPALEGVDYVINQIRVGGLEGRAVDETFPRAFGIPGEETVGPGGFNNSLRGIPVILDVCRMIEKLAPEALVLNLTNPSSIIQYAIRRYTLVRVVGTCNSPVSLMGQVARLLGVKTGDLHFDSAGMHHFGWIAGIQQGEVERLPEVLERVEELPKLGTDPELVRALGVIPSTYLRYYFHPDRVLAETEGREIRARQLMQLSEQMLADFRLWKPGDSTGMLARRGAIWYEEIVVPALLALAEGRTTELVLSVDNRDTLPWLPETAIVEVPVQIEGGRIAGQRGAELPQAVRAMIAQNCAYEMQAAEAIAEHDRSKALRALVSNLLVKDFNQARGLLSVIWPEEGQAGFTILLPEKKGAGAKPRYEKAARVEFKIPALHYGDSLLETYAPPEDDYALITMEELWPLVKDRLTRTPAQVLFVKELDWYRLEAMERALPAVSAVAGLGGGMAQDAAKYIAWRRHIPVDEFVSITSVDASVTKSIAARTGGHVTYIGYIVARDVYVDTRLIQSAPKRLNRSGVGDILCAYTALWDWKFAHEQTGESYDPQAVAATRDWLERVRTQAEEICAVSQAGIRTVMEAFEEISIICRRFGSSRPQEASDHTFAYNAEFQTRKNFLHGELVALGAWVMANLQDNGPEWLSETYARTGIRWQPGEIGLSQDEFMRILTTLNWYQSNFGRRYSVLNQRKIEPAFIDRMVGALDFSD